MKKVMVDNVPFLCLFATDDIKEGQELRYSYGDSKKLNLWWRQDNVSIHFFIFIFTWLLLSEKKYLIPIPDYYIYSIKETEILT